MFIPLHPHPLISPHLTLSSSYPYLHPYPVLSLRLLLFHIHILSLYCVPVGSLVGAYFIGRQLPYFGPEVYYDVLTSAGTYVRYLMGCDD